jgi:hypothetical protein
MLISFVGKDSCLTIRCNSELLRRFNIPPNLKFIFFKKRKAKNLIRNLGFIIDPDILVFFVGIY